MREGGGRILTAGLGGGAEVRGGGGVALVLAGPQSPGELKQNIRNSWAP